MCDLIDCKICNKSGVERKKYLIKQQIEENFCFEKLIPINKDICADCFKPESISGHNGQKVLIAMALYGKDFQDTFWKNSNFKREDVVTMIEAYEKLNELGVMHCPRIEERRKRSKEWIEHRNPFLIKKIKMPMGAVKLEKTNIIFKKDFDFLLSLPPIKIDGKLQMNFYGNTKHKLSEERILELYKMGWVRYGFDGQPKFGNHLVDEQRVCVKCGKIKCFNEFPHPNETVWEDANTKAITGCRRWECRDCESIRLKEYYEALPEEEKEAKRLCARLLRKTEKGKKKEKERMNKPHNRDWNNVSRNSTSSLTKIRKKCLNMNSPEIQWINSGFYNGRGCDLKDWKRYYEILFVIYDIEDPKGDNSKRSYDNDHIFPVSKFFSYIPVFRMIVSQCKLPMPLREVRRGYRGLEDANLNHFLNQRPMKSELNRLKSNIVDPDEINTHFEELSKAMPELFPNGYKPVPVEAFQAAEKKHEEMLKLRKLKPQQATQLELNYV